MTEETPLPPSPDEEGTPSPKEKRNHEKLGLGYLIEQLKFVLAMIVSSLQELFLKVINIQSTTDVEGTVASIKAGIEIKGYNVWILVAAAVLACIGLDTNSTAVIIGAMLISPLMSPILGLGLSIGINDRKSLQSAIYNFGIAVAVALLTAFIYFLITPLGRETPEMFARTKPTLLDIAVGFFGGVAGIVAGSRKDKTNAIPGVAIATALMPPLCVAGFGLAKFNLAYFAGAFYLFFLNAVFISLATFLIVRFLKFPLVERYTENFRRNFTRGVVAFVVISMVPAVWLFVDVIIDSRRDSRIEAFLDEKFGGDKLEFMVERKEVIERDSLDVLRVVVAGSIYLPNDTIEKYRAELGPKYGLKKLHLEVIQTTADPNDFEQTLQKCAEQTEATLSEFKHDMEVSEARKQEIEGLKAEIERLKNGEIPFMDIRDDLRDMIPELAKAEFGSLRSASFADSTKRNNPGSDGAEFMLRLTWADSLDQSLLNDRKTRIKERLLNKYAIEQLVLLDVNTPFRKK